MKISLGTLKDKGEGLVTFLEPRVGVKPELSGDSVEIDDEKVRKGVKPRHVKTYIKRFLFMNGLRKNYRVFVQGMELKVQEIVVGEKEEEEEKKPQPAKEAAEEKAPEPEEKEAEAEKPKKSAAKKPRSKKKAEEKA